MDDRRPDPDSRAAAAYSERFLAHLRSPRGQGSLAAPTHRGEAEDGVCGDRLSLDLAVEGDIVSQARFRVAGCPGAIAVASALATIAPGRAARTDSVSDADLERELGGVPPAKRHALRLARDAWRAALANALPPR